ncbi:endonuclease [Tenacibaculum maritimum]|uniref:Endonuclease/exonuclease/phosphatase domain-containing protein n=1 Tax=Tenacibaculum maritimum NCIMB 2154 TaxID=1349785 RepID=A0A2H1EE40_9FLAO|nr:endonuclease [Tenacibaculum maritimum]MCD9562085.1 endonuclease/exonuclease/phosphatase family protein [Tenacibaculum maritimum]MCD9565604.1 endonuclease/exonuclease/phosphatase family protein [Tenacibaculum maritimum]MCD9578473.1 endonuclease/exonuclease/phosphatase family protein [Tenacibaculum maritimum]MCD9596318.1 endonuclease/exonuclease/phosphatase family protein [Tenacibaculum maritimum]MCD9609435.1 endonuclease/exonuclease/phosphatase family protein [Tenacibaculum maritimum]
MKKIFTLIFILSITICFSQQKKRYDIRTVAFYNLENLFDTINDITKNDEASPIMKLRENRSKVYWDKIAKLSEVISQIGKEKTKTSPAILGIAEAENNTVLQNLINTKKLKGMYDIIHFDSPDERGIDVALLYQKKYFTPTHYEVFNPNIYVENRKKHTRDILLVTGYLDNELVHIIINHWPSRRGGEEKSSPLREKAAYKVTQIIQKIRNQDENGKILIMGDFNDDPINSSFKNVLKTKRKKRNVNKQDIYNPYEDMFRRGFSTLGHRDQLHLFDQILISSSLLNKNKKDFSSYKLFNASIFNKQFLINKKGRYKGYPKRSFSRGKYTGGYSDHYPVYIHLIRETNSY